MTLAATKFPAPRMRSSADEVLHASGSRTADSRIDAPGGGVAWRALSAGLWAARRDGRHLGTVQRGRRWLASDAESEPIGAFRTFDEAQAAVADPASPVQAARGTGAGGPLLVATGLLAAALTSALVWTSAALLL